MVNEQTDESHPKPRHAAERQITQNRESGVREREKENKLESYNREVSYLSVAMSEKKQNSQSRCKENKNFENDEIVTKAIYRNLGYIPVQLVNISKEELMLQKGHKLGEVSPLEIEHNVTAVTPINKRSRERETKEAAEFEMYLYSKLGHLERNDFDILANVLRNNRDVFYQEGSTDIGCTSKVKHEIKTGNASPVRKNPYRLAHSLKPVVEEQVQDMLRKEIIVESSSPWNSPIVMVKKKSKDGTPKYRLCVDLRGLNSLTKPDAYPLPNITDTLDSLGQCKVFSVLDMASGYLQIEIAEEDKEKTAFSTPQGHFHFNKMCFGLRNAPATYQRLMDTILMGLRGIDCLCYIDDLIMFSADVLSHALKLQKNIR